MKKLLLTLGTVAAAAAPIATVVSCGSDEEYDIYIFTGKVENITEFREAADSFNKLYKESYGKELNIRIVASGNGVDSNQSLASMMIRSNRPDVITSFGVGDVKAYVDNGDILPVDVKTDEDLKWADAASIASSATQDRLNEDLSLPNTEDSADKKMTQYGLALNYEAVGPIVNLKTLGELYSDGDDSTSVKDDGIVKYNEILANGISWTEYLDMKDKIETVTDDSVVNMFANATIKNEVEWISGFHMANNWLSKRTTVDGDVWNGYSNTYATFEDGAAYSTGNSENPIDFIGADSDKAIASLYTEYYGEDIFSASQGNNLDYDEVFGAFRDNKALLTHASTGMYGWIAGDDKDVLDLDDMVPFPMPLETAAGVYDAAGTDAYADIPVSNGMLWHLVDNNDDDRATLTKQFLRYVSAGEFVEKDGSIAVEKDGAKGFYNSDNSQLVNPYAGSDTTISGQDLTSKVVTAQIKGQTWVDFDTVDTNLGDGVTLWTNGALSPWSDEQLGVDMLVDAGKSTYKGTMSTENWDKFKKRLVI